MTPFTLYKRPILICIGFLFLIQLLNAQNDSIAKIYFDNNDLVKAKESIDVAVADMPNNEEAWFLKAKIYNAISKNNNTKNLLPDGYMDAFLSLKKAAILNSEYINKQLKQTNYQLPFNLYNSYTTQGLQFYNLGISQNDKENFAKALINFKKAREIGKYIYSNNWGLYSLDSMNIVYISKSAIKASNDDDALLYCKLIADNNIVQLSANNDCLDIYKWLTYYYKTKNDSLNFVKYKRVATKNFPSLNYFTLINIDWLREHKDYLNMFAQYQDILTQKSVDVNYRLNYYTDIYNYLYSNHSHKNNNFILKDTLIRGLKNLVKLYPANDEALLLIGKYFINQVTELQKNTNSKNNELEYTNKCKNLYTEANFYLERVIQQNNKAKITYKEAVQLLIVNYKILNMPDKIKKYKALTN